MKKILSSILALTMVLSFSTVALATESDIAAAEISESAIPAAESDIPTLDIPEDAIPENPTPLNEGLGIEFGDADLDFSALDETESDVEDLESIDSPFDLADFAGADGLDADDSVGEYQLEDPFLDSPYSVTQNFNISMGATGSMQYSTAAVGPGEIIHATLACPRNASLNWDLFIVELDPNTMVLGNTVASSRFATIMNTYADGVSRTMDEACSYINTSSSTQYFAIIAQATVGGTTATGTLTVSIDHASYDDGLTDYPSTAYFIPLSNTVDGANLNVSNDVDWFAIDNANGELRQVIIDTDNSDVDIQVYSYTNGGMKLVGNNSAVYTLPKGDFYVRVSHKSPTTPISTILPYSISNTYVQGVPARIYVKFDGDMKPEYATYFHGYGFRTKNLLDLRIAVLTASGLPVYDQFVSCTFENPTWMSMANPTLGTKYFYAVIGDEGYVDVQWTIPTSYDNYYYVIDNPYPGRTSVHRYDISNLTFNTGSLQYYIEFYHVFLTDRI